MAHVLQDCKQGEAAAIIKLTKASTGEIVQIPLRISMECQRWNARLQSMQFRQLRLVDELGAMARCNEAAVERF